MKPSYSLRQQKIYTDYNPLSDEKLQEYVDNENKYDFSVIEIIKDILIERDLLKEGISIGIEPSIKKQRHSFVTAWLVLMIVINALISIIYLITANQMVSSYGGEIGGAFIIILIISGLLNIYFTTLLMSWKKLGFNAIAITSSLIFILNLYQNVGFGKSLIGLFGILILYVILQIEKDGISAWDQLE